MNLKDLLAITKANDTETKTKELEKVLKEDKEIKIIKVDDLPVTDEVKEEFHKNGKEEVVLDCDNQIIHSDVYEKFKDLLCQHENIVLTSSMPIENTTSGYYLSYACDECGLEIPEIPITDITPNLFPRRINMKTHHVCVSTTFDEIDTTMEYYRNLGYSIVNLMEYTKNTILIEFSYDEAKEKLLEALKTFVGQ